VSAVGAQSVHPDRVTGVCCRGTACCLFVQFLLLSTVEDLLVHVDRDQLTADLGGTFPFNVHEWIQHRAVCFCLVLILPLMFSRLLIPMNSYHMLETRVTFQCSSAYCTLSNNVKLVYWSLADRQLYLPLPRRICNHETYSSVG